MHSLEVFVDTVDYTGNLDESAEAPQLAEMLASDLAFVFGDYPPLLVERPNLGAHPSAARWHGTRSRRKRLRVTYQTGQSAFFEAGPESLANRLAAQPLQLLALGPRDDCGLGAGRRRLVGSSTLPLTGYRPPAAAAWHRLGGRGSAVWGCEERAVPVLDLSGRTVAVALVVVSLSQLSAALRGAFEGHQRGEAGAGPLGGGASPAWAPAGSPGQVETPPGRGLQGAEALGPGATALCPPPLLIPAPAEEPAGVLEALGVAARPATGPAASGRSSAGAPTSGAGSLSVVFENGSFGVEPSRGGYSTLADHSPPSFSCSGGDGGRDEGGRGQGGGWAGASPHSALRIEGDGGNSSLAPTTDGSSEGSAAWGGARGAGSSSSGGGGRRGPDSPGAVFFSAGGGSASGGLSGPPSLPPSPALRAPLPPMGGPSEDSEPSPRSWHDLSSDEGAGSPLRRSAVGAGVDPTGAEASGGGPGAGGGGGLGPSGLSDSVAEVAGGAAAPGFGPEEPGQAPAPAARSTWAAPAAWGRQQAYHFEPRPLFFAHGAAAPAPPPQLQPQPQPQPPPAAPPSATPGAATADLASLEAALGRIEARLEAAAAAAATTTSGVSSTPVLALGQSLGEPSALDSAGGGGGGGPLLLHQALAEMDLLRGATRSGATFNSGGGGGEGSGEGDPGAAAGGAAGSVLGQLFVELAALQRRMPFDGVPGGGARMGPPPPPPPPPPEYSPGAGGRVESWFAAHEVDGTVGLAELAGVLAEETGCGPGAVAAWVTRGDVGGAGRAGEGDSGGSEDSAGGGEGGVAGQLRVSYAQAMGLLSRASAGEDGAGELASNSTLMHQAE